MVRRTQMIGLKMRTVTQPAPGKLRTVETAYGKGFTKTVIPVGKIPLPVMQFVRRLSAVTSM